VLTIWAEMGSPAGKKNAPDGRLATAAGQAGSHVDAVLKLKKAPHAVGIDIIGDGGTAEPDGLLQNLAEGEPEPLKFSLGEAAGTAARPDTGVEEALVGVDIAHTGKEGLVEQGRFDGQAPSAEEGGKFLRGDREGLVAGGRKGRTPAEISKFEPAKAARVDEAQLQATFKAEAGMGVGGQGSFGRGHQEAAGHAEMDNPLGVRGGCGRRPKLADDVLSSAMHSHEHAAFKTHCLAGARCFKGLGVAPEPRLNDAVAAHTLVDAASYGLHFGQFGHSSIVGRVERF